MCDLMVFECVYSSKCHDTVESQVNVESISQGAELANLMSHMNYVSPSSMCPICVEDMW